MPNKPETPKKDSSPKRLSLDEYSALKGKRLKEDYRMPLLVKLFIALPILILVLLLFFGIYYIPRITPSSQPLPEENASNQ